MGRCSLTTTVGYLVLKVSQNCDGHKISFNLSSKKLTCTEKVSYWKQIATIRQIIFFPTGNISLLSVKFSISHRAAKIGLDALSSSLVLSHAVLDVVIDDKVRLLFRKAIMLSPIDNITTDCL